MNYKDIEDKARVLYEKGYKPPYIVYGNKEDFISLAIENVRLCMQYDQPWTIPDILEYPSIIMVYTQYGMVRVNSMKYQTEEWERS